MTAYGIDLGSTYSCIAKVDETGQAVVLNSADGEATTPSVVYFESPDNVVVGREAKNSAVVAPDLVVEHVKRQMGQDIHYTFHGHEHTPESISALIIRELARAAQHQTNEVVRDVVITVPASFGMLEREATRKAGQIAGLNVLDVLAEPVAAALAYQALGANNGVRHILVYDLGGGTFDATVIRLDGDNIQVVCADGNHQLGGADWDSKIIDFLLRGFTDQYPPLDPSSDEQFLQELANSAEQLKRTLSATQTSRRSVRFDGSVVQLELTRAHLEELTSELLELTMRITERAIATARENGVERFDEVLLVGGMTRMPVIAKTLRERFKVEPKVHDPDLAVAKGAALFALIPKMKVSMPGTNEYATPQAAQEVADQLGLSVEQVVATAVASSALLPFIQALAARAADDVYSTLRRLRFHIRPRDESSLTQSASAIYIADELSKVVLELPPTLNFADQESLHRLLDGLVHQVPNLSARWLQIGPCDNAGRWKVQLVNEIPDGSVVLGTRTRPFADTSNPEHRRPRDFDAAHIERRERIAALERERKLLREMVRYLAREISP